MVYLFHYKDRSILFPDLCSKDSDFWERILSLNSHVSLFYLLFYSLFLQYLWQVSDKQRRSIVSLSRVTARKKILKDSRLFPCKGVTYKSSSLDWRTLTKVEHSVVVQLPVEHRPIVEFLYLFFCFGNSRSLVAWTAGYQDSHLLPCALSLFR